MKIYLDTSVFGGCFEKEFELFSNKLIEKVLEGKLVAVISDITLQELSGAPIFVRSLAEKIISENAEMIVANDEAKNLAEFYLKEKIVTRKYLPDALHIALGTIHKVDVLASWNFKHIVNLNRIRLYSAVNLKHGYNLIEIRSPRELIEL